MKNSATAGGIGYTMEQSPTLATDGKTSVLQPKPVMLKIRQPRNEKLGGHGAMWKEDQAYTLATHQDQTLFQNGMGK